MADNSEPEKMQESWVEVQEQQGGGTLIHTSSKEQMKHLLASAASEEEELSDSEQLYQVTFQTTDTPEDEDTGLVQVLAQKPSRYTQKPSSQEQYQSEVSSIPVYKIPVAPSISTSSGERHNSGICSLTFLVPVIILTHLAIFGIGYYLGRRWSADGSSTVLKVFHV